MEQLTERAGGRFAAFLSQQLHANAVRSLWSQLTPIRAELFSAERLEAHARSLAAAQAVTAKPALRRSLVRRLSDNAEFLHEAYKELSAAADAREAVSPAAEWIIDNNHIIARQVREIRTDFPSGFYRRLPKLATGPLYGYPRVFGAAWAYVAHTDSHFDPDVFCRYLCAYQEVQPLDIGELWAAPITLRLLLVENLRRHAAVILENRRARDDAVHWADRLLRAAQQSAPLPPLLQDLDSTELTHPFIVEFSQRLRDQDPQIGSVMAWLDRRLAGDGVSVDDIVQAEQQRQINATVTVRNIITSMRLITDVDWTVLVERVSLVDAELRKAGVYRQSDFPTRDLYRHALEQLARGSKHDEVNVARAAVAAGQQGAGPDDGDQRRAEPGYYLLGAGRREFEAAIAYRPPISSWPGRVIRSLGIGGYVATGILVSVALLASPLWLLHLLGVDLTALAWLAAFGAIPAADAGVALVNHIVTRGFRATILPALEFAGGVPVECRTIVVVPFLLTSKEAIEDQVERLEVHHLSAPKGDLCFALLSDWTDADGPHADGDAELLEAAARGIADLNRRYGPAPAGERFHLLHRKRVWVASEGKWIGWERKRGKLSELNQLLRGAADTTFIDVDGRPPRPPEGVRFVITLDADTRLTHDAIGRLIGKMAHPLNRPRYDPEADRVVEGYAILQPRVTPAMPIGRQATPFLRVFSNMTGIDPYAAAASDVYQDLLGEGTYTGKGIYDVSAFEAALAGRVPESSLLSHDLFEGVFARSGLVSDIEFIEEFPIRYDAAASRHHRWARGDWQLLPWILGLRRSPAQRRRSGVPALGRWKMLDNLRRSMSAPSAVLALLACLVLPLPAALVWTGFVLLTIALPPFIPVASRLLPERRGGTLRVYLRTLGWDIRMAVAQWALATTFLAHQACLMTDAAARTIYRLVSRKRLLEWTPAAQAAIAPAPTLLSYYRYMSGALAIATAALLISASQGAQTAPLAISLALLWGLSPAAALWASQPRIRRGEHPLPDEHRRTLRLIGRRTWRYFEHFVTAEHHMLPPDNFQEWPQPVVANRTSPTNIGLYLLSVASAYEFGWIGAVEAVDRLEKTLSTLDLLERWHGHFYNWYDTRDTRPLEPRYVSSVDSGNLAGHFVTVAGMCREWSAGTADPYRLHGVIDVLMITRAQAQDLHRERRLPSLDWSWLEDQLGALETGVRQASTSGGETAISELARAAELISDTVRAHAHDDRSEASQELAFWTHALSTTLQAHADDYAALRETGLRDRLASIAARMHQLANDMDFGLLLNRDRLLLSIGFRGADGVLDPSCYDLLASEARLASFLAIAKGDIPTKHWFRLSHAVAALPEGAALVSWSGSMFEYLMPSLVMQEPTHSLLERTNRLVVRRQIQYGRRLRIPWGVSESAYNAQDLELTYQYQSFGIPEVALKRGLADNVVVSPYATALAGMLAPWEAVRNFEALSALGAHGRFGFYEAIDFTRERLPAGKQFEIVRAFMAHHQGMTIAAIANVLLDGRLRKHFHADPNVRASELLLQERMPRNIQEPAPFADAHEAVARAALPPPTPAQGRRRADPTSMTPATHLLSNGRYTVMLTAAGSGYSEWRGMAITRWREDATCDDWGAYIYLRDVQSGDCWSPTLQPIRAADCRCETSFDEDRAEFCGRRDGITATLEVLVSEEDDAEIRLLSIANTTGQSREIEVTSFAELVLAPQTSDTAHPAFSKLFVETEHHARSGALLARRRRRSPSEDPVWAAHFVVAEGVLLGQLEFETDRAKFFGRSRDVHSPIAVLSGSPLSCTTGATLDPIFAIRRRVRIEPGESARLHFWTVAAGSRAAVLELVDKNNNAAAFERAAALSWTQAQVQLRHLNIDRAAAALYQKLAAHVVFATPLMRPGSDVIAAGLTGQPQLWSVGLSGDLPIVLVRLSEMQEIGIVREALQAFEYLRIKGLPFDLVLLNERETSYLQDLQNAIENLAQAAQARPHGAAAPVQGHIYVLRADLLSSEVKAALISAARVVLHGERGRLADQLTRRPAAAGPAPSAQARKGAASVLHPPTVAPDLEFFNGVGGFADSGREYVIVLGPGQFTPAPWINVIANPDFGFQTSESGAGFTWSQSSRERQITPWSNDAISDHAGQALYVLDLEDGVLISPTASPVHDEQGAYVVRHGWGYSRFEHEAHGLQLDLLEYVPVADTLRISRLRITNPSRRTRQLAVTAYAEWSLSPSRASSAPFIRTELDPDTGAIFASNRWNPAFEQRIAFADLLGRQESWTGDRREFIGRNGGLSAPAAVLNQAPLSDRLGAGFDPCAALQTRVTLAPGESTEIVFLLGDASNAAEARQLVERYRAASLDDVLESVRRRWRDILGVVQVQTPDRSVDIMLNGWLLYQTLASRLWARCGFYQVSGAYGFRDQLQDVMAFAPIHPQIARAHIVRAAGRQFPEGDVQHWWLPHTEQGVRTRFSDDRVWLASTTARYVRISGDEKLLDEQIPFLTGPQLRDDEAEAFFRPEVSVETASVYEHCARALDASLAVGAHGAPLFGGGDWNDAMNLVGAGGRGESVWLGWFLFAALSDFAPIAASRGDETRARRWREHADVLRESLNCEAWDGEWFRRGWYDDGSPLGSASSDECRIDSIAQSWAVISGAGDPELSRRAMAAVERDLIRSQDSVALLFMPPFDRTSKEPGYIKGYPPGVRENGGQYTHAALWSVMAFAALGEGDKAAGLFWMLNPINHTRTRTDLHRYKLEPYVVAADVYAAWPHVGRGGWSWYTGSAGVMHRAGLENVLGLRFLADRFSIDPCIPRSWPQFEITLRLPSARYRIRVQNPHGVCRGITEAQLDGAPIVGRPPVIVLHEDAQIHHVDITLG
jgi:cyclic beta-1,2-glucan synthetase